MGSSDTYCAYLLRLWRAADGRWRAVLVDPRTGEQRAFATLEHCWEFLRRCLLAGQFSQNSPTVVNQGEHLRRDAPADPPAHPAAGPNSPPALELD